MHRIQEKLLKLIGQAQIGGLTLREIGELVGEDSPQKVKHHLEKLQVKGLINLNKSQQIIMLAAVTEDNGLVSIPIIGSANCGPATIYAVENVEGYLKVSPKMIGIPSSSGRQGNLFAIKANGSSLNRADIHGKNIESGDFVIIDRSRTAPVDGEYVVSIIDGMANIKKFKLDRPNNRIVLLSESTHTILPIFVHEDDSFLINGTVIDVVKKFTS